MKHHILTPCHKHIIQCYMYNIMSSTKWLYKPYPSPSKTNQTRWGWHHNTFHHPYIMCHFANYDTTKPSKNTLSRFYGITFVGVFKQKLISLRKRYFVHVLLDCNLFEINISYGFRNIAAINLLCQQPSVQLIVTLTRYKLSPLIPIAPVCAWNSYNLQTR